MALIKCNECGKSVSDSALICPQCGYVHPAASKEDKIIITQFSKIANTARLGGFAFFSGVIWLVIAGMSGREVLEMAWPYAKWLIGGGAFWYILAEIDRNLSLRKLKKQSKLK